MNADSQIKDDYAKVTSVEDTPRDRGIAVGANKIGAAIFDIKGEFHALSNRCSHQNVPLYEAGEKKINAEYTWTKSRGGVNEEELGVSYPRHLQGPDIESNEHEVSGKCIGTFDAKTVDGDVCVRI